MISKFCPRIAQSIVSNSTTRFSSVASLPCNRFHDMIDKPTLKSLLESKNPSFHLIDVRSREEVEGGKIINAKHIPIDELYDAFALDKQEFKNRFGFEKFHKHEHLVFYCRSGARGNRAMFFAQRMGHNNVQNFVGGYKKWIDKSCITTQEVEGVINASDKHFHLIDVREKSELESSGVIPTAKHIPIREMAEAFTLSKEDFKIKYGFEKFNANENLIFYCEKGKRSEWALYIAKKMGFTQSRNYKGSWLEWSACH